MNTLKRLWGAIPLKLMLLLTVAGLASTEFHPRDGKKYPRGEFYPLSSYPMYSSFRGRDYYFYLADGEGEAVPCKAFGITAPKLKKRFKSELKDAELSESKLRDRQLPPEQIGELAGKVLRRLAKEGGGGGVLSPGEQLTMRLVYVWSEDGEIKKSDYHVAGVTLGS